MFGGFPHLSNNIQRYEICY